MHSHIGGGKVNIARMLMPEEHRLHRRSRRRERRRCGSGHATPVDLRHRLRLCAAWATPRPSSRRCCRPMRARRTRRWATSPMLDKGAYVLLGNDDLFLRNAGRAAGGERRSATTSPGPCTPPRRWRQDRQPGRHRRIQVQRPQARPRRDRAALRRHAAPDPDLARRRADANWACRTRSTSMAATSACPATIATTLRHHRRAWKAAAST